MKEVKRKEYVPIPVEKDLAENMFYCCEESGVNMIDVVDYGLRILLSNYIDKRNDHYAKMTPDEIQTIYPEMDDETAVKVIELAKNNSLAIIKPIAEGNGYEEATTGVVDSRLCESCKRLQESEERFNNSIQPDGFNFTTVVPDKVYTKMPSIAEDNSEAILPALGSLIEKAHHVNVNIQVVMGDD